MPLLPSFLSSQRACATAIIAASVVHAPTLWVWAPFCWSSLLFSASLLAPIVSLYLVATAPQKEAEVRLSRSYPLAALAFAISLFFVFASKGFLSPADPSPDGIQSWLFLRMLAWTTTAWGALFLFGGPTVWRQFCFPAVYLVAAVPIPPAFEHQLEHWLMHGSASFLAGALHLTGPSFFRQGTLFQLPGITIEVAPECSGINATVVLFLVSFVAGYLFLKRHRHRLILTAFVLPLALARNAFRVWVLVQLCVYDDVSWIHSPLHHQGGPLFFALSLLPFSGLLYWLIRRERTSLPSVPTP